MAYLSFKYATTTTEMAQRLNTFTLLGIGSTLTVLPFLLLVCYWHPVGTHAFDWASDWGGQFTDLNWWQQQRYWYLTTMGRYASTALLSVTHYWYSLLLARLLIGGLHLLLGYALWKLIGAVFSTLDRKDVLVITMVVLALYIQQLSGPYDTLYRLSGVLTYQTGFIALLFAAKYAYLGRWWVVLPFIVFAVGTNEITLIQCGLLISIALLCCKGFWQATSGKIVIIAALLAAAIALFAPGNWVRATGYENEGATLFRLIGLTLATATYTWVGWCSGTALLPLLILLRPWLPEQRLTTEWRGILLLSIVIWVPMSFAPVIIATQGDSLPEGIADWQIIIVFGLLLLYSTTLPTYRLPKLVNYGLVLFITSSFCFSGLSIDRGRAHEYSSPVDRIQMNAIAGNAWLQLLRGTSARYSASVKAQYAVLENCQTATCTVPALEATKENFLYDPIYDRRINPAGDPFMCYLFGCGGSIVKIDE